MSAEPSLDGTRVDVHLGPEELAAELRADVLAGLRSRPKELPPRWFYDERGSALFEAITDLPEYYLTRREREILRERAGAIAALSRADTLVELGSGTAEKTRLLLDALAASGRLRRYVPLDVSEPTLRAAAAAISSEYPGIEVHAAVGDFERHLRLLPDGGRRLVAFLGSTVGNLTPERRAAFFAAAGEALDLGDTLLLGTDLVKDAGRLVAAYDDDAGVTAEFNLNVLSVLNRELGADFEPGGFEHVARFDRGAEWIEMLLRSREAQTVRVRDLGLEVRFDPGEEMRTEISAKFRRERIEVELEAAGLRIARWWTDRRGDFALSLIVRA